jgi:hypothetical protein
LTVMAELVSVPRSVHLQIALSGTVTGVYWPAKPVSKRQGAVEC